MSYFTRSDTRRKGRQERKMHMTTTRTAQGTWVVKPAMQVEQLADGKFRAWDDFAGFECEGFGSTPRTARVFAERNRRLAREAGEQELREICAIDRADHAR